MTIPISILSDGTHREEVSGRHVEPRSGALDTHHQALTRVSRPVWENATLAEINRILKQATIGVQFEFDTESETIIAEVVDVETGKLIRQMAYDEVMQLSKVLGKLHDLLVHQAICRKARAMNTSLAAAPTRWSSPWATVPSHADSWPAPVSESSNARDSACP